MLIVSQYVMRMPAFLINSFVQAALFNRTVKMIEGDDISATEVGGAITLFIQALKERKNDKYLTAAVRAEIQRAAVVDATVTITRVLEVAEAECSTVCIFFYIEYVTCF